MMLVKIMVIKVMYGDCDDGIIVMTVMNSDDDEW